MEQQERKIKAKEKHEEEVKVEQVFASSLPRNKTTKEKDESGSKTAARALRRPRGQKPGRSGPGTLGLLRPGLPPARESRSRQAAKEGECSSSTGALTGGMSEITGSKDEAKTYVRAGATGIRKAGTIGVGAKMDCTGRKGTVASASWESFESQ